MKLIGFKENIINYSCDDATLSHTIKQFVTLNLHKKLSKEDRKALANYIKQNKSLGVEANRTPLGGWAFSTIEELRFLPTLRMLIVGILLVSILISTDPVYIPALHTTQTFGALIYPLVYLFLDSICELYGYKNARVTVYITVATLLACAFLLSLALPLIDHSTVIYEAMHTKPRRILVNAIALVCADLVVATVFSWLKALCDNKHLWFRSLLSSCVGQLVYVGVGWPIMYGVTEITKHDLSLMVENYVFILIYCAILVPFVYGLTSLLRTYSKKVYCLNKH